MSEIVVIGSLNIDLVVTVDRAPRPGETISGSSFNMIPGGKGANQAVAARKMGAETMMIGCLGNDAFGHVLLDSLRSNGVNTQHLQLLDGVSTGSATIIVEESGENRIIIVPGANAKISPDQIDALADVIKASKMVVLQFEIPMEVNAHAIEFAHTNNLKVLLNPAPAYPISDHLLSMVDILVINETEATMLTDHPVDGITNALEAAQMLHQRGSETVIVTLGDKGAVLFSEDYRLHAPALPVEVVDTTAAGDAFVGGLVTSLVRGGGLEKALQYAVAAGSLAVTRLGSQPSIPTHQEVLKNLVNLHLNQL